MIVAWRGQPLGEVTHERSQLRRLGKSFGDLLQWPKAVQHPEFRQRYADFRLVVIVFVVPGAGFDAYALGVLPRKAAPGLGQRRMRLDREHLAYVQNLKQ